MKKAIILLLVVSLFFVSGCTDQTITSSRDLNGVWQGHSIAFTDRAFDCSYTGDMTLNLVHNGNNLQGNYNLIVRSAQGNNCVRIGSELGYVVSGTVSSSAIDLSVDNTDSLVGSFTTDLMTLRWQDCETCGSGPAVKLVGPAQLQRK